MAHIKDLTIDGVSFNTEWAWGKTEADFVKEFAHVDHIYPDAPNKDAKLKEAYGLIQKEKPKDFVAPKPLAAAPLAANIQGQPGAVGVAGPTGGPAEAK